MYLLDTDVLSMTSPTSGFSNAEVDAWRRWVEHNQDDLYFSVVTIMEVRFGIEKALGKGATNKAGRLQKWLAAAETTYRTRIIPVTAEIAHVAGRRLYGAVAAGMMPSSEDAIIAATAEVKGLTLLSRNSKDMKALRAHWSNPLDSLPPSKVD